MFECYASSGNQKQGTHKLMTYGWDIPLLTLLSGTNVWCLNCLLTATNTTALRLRQTSWLRRLTIQVIAATAGLFSLAFQQTSAGLRRALPAAEASDFGRQQRVTPARNGSTFTSGSENPAADTKLIGANAQRNHNVDLLYLYLLQKCCLRQCCWLFCRKILKNHMHSGW